MIMGLKRQVVEINGSIYEVVATYYNESNNKNYIIYTDQLETKNPKVNIYSGLYEMINGKVIVKEIVEEEDKNIISEILEEIKKMNI